MKTNDPGVRRWLIACDESGVHGAPHYGFGTLWLKWQRRGDFYRTFHELKQQYRFDRELKWSTIRSQDLEFYKAITEYFFKRRWAVFHCAVFKKQYIDRMKYHDGDWDLARRKHFTRLLTNKMGRALARYPEREHEFRIWVDPIASRYAKADEAVHVIANNTLKRNYGVDNSITAVITHNSENSPAIQVSDFFLGAVMETWHQKIKSAAKNEVRQFIAEHLGWPALDSDTFQAERKFNVWYFFDPTRTERPVRTRRVRLKYPYFGDPSSVQV